MHFSIIRKITILFVLCFNWFSDHPLKACPEDSLIQLDRWAKQHNVTLFDPNEPHQLLGILSKGLTDLPELLKILNKSEFYLQHNSFSTLPRVLQHFPNMTVLNLMGNRLNSLPNWMRDFKNLHTLNVHNNHFEAVPEVIRHLSSLKNLNISQNSIQSLPNWITELQELKSLTISETLQNMESLMYLHNLETLIINTNKYPFMVTYKGPEQIENYLGRFLGSNTKNAAQD